MMVSDALPPFTVLDNGPTTAEQSFYCEGQTIVLTLTVRGEQLHRLYRVTRAGSYRTAECEMVHGPQAAP